MLISFYILNVMYLHNKCNFVIDFYITNVKSKSNNYIIL